MRLWSIFAVGVVASMVLIGPKTMFSHIGTWFKRTSSSVGQHVQVFQKSFLTATSTQATFYRPKDAPYAITFLHTSSSGSGRWDLVVGEQVRGFYHTASTTYEAFGEKRTGEDGFVMRAVGLDGEQTIMQATTTWKGDVVEGEEGLALLPLEDAQASVSFLSTHGVWRDNLKRLRCTYDLLMPVVEPSMRVPTSVVEAINKDLRALMIEGYTTPEQAKEAYTRSCQEDLRADPSTDQERAAQATVRVGMNHFPWLSFETDEYVYTGGVHGNGGKTGVIFDLRTGKTASLSEVFGLTPDALPRLHVRIGEKLLAQNQMRGEWIYEETASSIRAFVGAKPRTQQRLWDEGRTGIPTSTNVVLTQEGVRILFQSYEIAPYAAGLPVVFLSNKELIH